MPLGLKAVTEGELSIDCDWLGEQVQAPGHAEPGGLYQGQWA